MVGYDYPYTFKGFGQKTVTIFSVF